MQTVAGTRSFPESGLPLPPLLIPREASLLRRFLDQSHRLFGLPRARDSGFYFGCSHRLHDACERRAPIAVTSRSRSAVRKGRRASTSKPFSTACTNSRSLTALCAIPHATSVTSPHVLSVRFVTPIFHSEPLVCPIPPLGSDRFNRPPAAPK